MKRLNKIFVFGCVLIILINLFPLTSLAGKTCDHAVIDDGYGHLKCALCSIQIHYDSDKDGRCNGTSCNKKTKLITYSTASSIPWSSLENETKKMIDVDSDLGTPDEPRDLSKGCTGETVVDLIIEDRVYQYYLGTSDKLGGPTKYEYAKPEYFKCRIDGVANKENYQEIMVPYYIVETFYYETYPGFFKAKPTYVTEEVATLKHTTIFVNTKSFPLSLEDVHIDLDGGRLVISGTMHDDTDAWNQIFSSISGIIVGITGLGTLCCLLAMIVQILKLGAAAGNPMDREKALKGVLWTGIGTAGCGAAALIFGLAYNIL